jgi:hypothetical protein
MPTYQYHSEKFLTSDKALVSTKAYQKVAKIMENVMASGAVALGAGACIGMSRLIYSALKHQGINSHLMECQLTYTQNKDQPNELTSFVGFDDIKNPGEIDTHVVVIAETIPPLMIDASLTHRFGLVVIDSVNYFGTDGTFGDYYFKEYNLKCLYQQKAIQKIPLTQQISFVDRMETDNKIFGRLTLLKWMIGFAITISFINASRGFYDYYLKYWDPEGGWGPEAIEQLDKKLDHLNKKLDQLELKK